MTRFSIKFIGLALAVVAGCFSWGYYLGPYVDLYLASLHKLKSGAFPNPLTFFPSWFLILVVVSFLWPLLTGVSLFLLRSWARVSVILMSVLALWRGSMFLTGMVIANIFPSSPWNTHVYHYEGLRLVLIMFPYFFLWIVIPSFLLYFFTAPAVKEEFALAHSDKRSKEEPLGLIILGVGYLSYAVLLSMGGMSPAGESRTALFNFVLTGSQSDIFTWVSAGLYFLWGVGFLALSRLAFRTFFVIQSIKCLYTLLAIFIYSESTLREILFFQESFPGDSLVSVIRLTLGLFLLINVTIMMYVHTQRSFFFPEEAE